MRTWGFAALLFTQLHVKESRSEPCPVIPTYIFYSVTGTTAKELQESLLQRGPRDETGAVRFAHTDWTVRWKWKRFDNGLVDPDSAQISCVAKITLPKLESPESLAPQLASDWEAFVERTRKHELNHVQHVEQTAPQIVERLNRSSKENGALTTKRAESIVREVVAEIRALDRSYDAATDHGRTEGTWRVISHR